MEEKLSKKDLKHQKRLAELEARSSQAKQATMKWIVIGIVSVLFIAFFAFLIYSIKVHKQTVATASLARNGEVRGTGPVTLLEYGDLQCPACKAYEPWVEQLSKDFKGKMKLIFKNYPLQQHQNAMAAAEFAEAAGKQGKYWQVHDLLYAKQDEWGEQTDPQPFFDKYAQSLKLDLNKLHKDEKDPATAAHITQNQNDGIAAGVDATPTFFLNNKQIDNPSSYDAFKKLISDALKKNG